MQRITEYKKYFLYAMIASLISGALVAAGSVLIGSFTDTTGKIVGTLIAIIVHALISFYVIPDNKENNIMNKYKIFSDVLFFLLATSFVTSIFAIWELMSETLTAQLYGVYTTFALTSLQINAYTLLETKNKALRISSLIGTFLAMIFGLLITFLIFGADSWLESTLETYYRFLGAVGILDGATLVIVAVLYKLHLQKHPEETNVLKTDGKSSFLRIIGIIILTLIALNIVGSLLFWLLFSINSDF
jgi:hypothetical protein